MIASTRPSDLIFPGVSEFGERMAACLRSLPWALGVVLCDAQGDAVDFAYRSSRLSALDIQLCGSQLTRTMQAIGHGRRAQTLGATRCVLESPGGVMILEDLGESYILTLRMERHCDLQKSLGAFDGLAKALWPLVFDGSSLDSQRSNAAAA